MSKKFQSNNHSAKVLAEYSLGDHSISEVPMDEDLLRTVVAYLVRLTEAGATVVIFTGTLICFFQYALLGLKPSSKHTFLSIRINLGRFLALGLEFQLASDLLRTAVAPSFEEIGKLAAVAAIRTSLNYFLSKETLSAKDEVKPSEHG